MKIYKIVFTIFLLCFAVFFASCVFAKDVKKIIYPSAKEALLKEGMVEVDASWSIACLDNCQEYLSLVDKFVDEFREKYNINLHKGSTIQNQEKKIVICKYNDKFTDDLLLAENISKDKVVTDEAYIIISKKDTIYIIAAGHKGVYYACNSLMQLFEYSGNKLLLPAVNIIDYPTVPIRAVHLSASDPDLIKKELKEIARLKYNTVILDSWDYFSFSDAKIRSKWEDIYDYARSMYLEPICELQSFGVAGALLHKDPQAAEGIWIKDAKVKFINDMARPLNPDKVPMINILRNRETNIKITSLDKKIIYKENVDYQVIDGDLFYPYNEDAKPFKVMRRKEGNIQDGQLVLMSYDYVERRCKFADWSIPYCPSSAITYKLMSETINNVVFYLNPAYINIGHDEIRGMNRDSRCLSRNKTNAELFYEDVNRLYNIIKDCNANIKILMWADMLNPWHNGGNDEYQIQFGGIKGRTDMAIDFIANDIILILWHASNENIEKAPQYFRGKGFNYWANGPEWLDAEFKPRGVVVTTWEGWQKEKSKIFEMAEILW